MAETGGETSQTEQLKTALEQRATQLHEETQGRAADLLARSGEGAAAPFLAAHEALNSLFRSLGLTGPEDVKAFSGEMFETIRGMSDAIVMGRTDLAYKRQKKIADLGKLAPEVRKAVFSVTDNIGPNETRLTTDYRLK